MTVVPFASGLHDAQPDKVSAPVAYRGRDEAKGRAAEHLRLGNSQAAYDCFQKAVDISPEVANRFVQVSLGHHCAGLQLCNAR